MMARLDMVLQDTNMSQLPGLPRRSSSVFATRQRHGIDGCETHACACLERSKVTSDDLEARGRERSEADAQYNAALTGLDTAVVAISRLPSVGPEHRERLGTALMQFLQQIT